MLFQSYLVLFIFLTDLALLADETYKYSGLAYHLRTKEFLYSDNHTESIQNGKHVSSIIEYKDKNGKIFAVKKINFQKNPHLPDFTLEDFRDGYIEGASLNGNKITLKHRVNAESNLEQKVFDLPENPVIDGGFDYFLRDNWNKLLDGRKVIFHMFAPSKMNYYRFKVVLTKKAEFKGREAYYFKIDLDSLLGIFLPSVIIVYDAETKRIVHYEGISNINDESGKSYFVRIVYEHTEKGK
ncbi:MAG: hypothetical protein N3A69_12065 [Leptospiraceae bacterium]|nr:hypothetical protein [Leptospiraceae bacterium]